MISELVDEQELVGTDRERKNGCFNATENYSKCMYEQEAPARTLHWYMSLPVFIEKDFILGYN